LQQLVTAAPAAHHCWCWGLVVAQAGQLVLLALVVALLGQLLVLLLLLLPAPRLLCHHR
jgi:hypothetical protein